MTTSNKMKPAGSSSTPDPKWKWIRRGLAIGGVAGIGGAIFYSCGPDYSDEWAEAPGTRGFVNLDSVRDAFKKNSKIEAFEKRVNEIYEGDGLVLFDLRESRKGFVLKGYEDIDNSKQLVASLDDHIFTLETDSETKKATLKGVGVNGYYKSTWAYDPPIEEAEDDADTAEVVDTDVREDSWYRHRHYGHYYHHGGYYRTPYGAYPLLWGHRSSYRSSTRWHSQIKTNEGFASKMRQTNKAGFDKAMGQPSAGRAAYINNSLRSGDLDSKLRSQKATSGWGARETLAAKGTIKKTSATAYKKGYGKVKSKSSSRSRSGSRSGRASGRSSSRGGGWGGFSGFPV